MGEFFERFHAFQFIAEHPTLFAILVAVLILPVAWITVYRSLRNPEGVDLPDWLRPSPQRRPKFSFCAVMWFGFVSGILVVASIWFVGFGLALLGAIFSFDVKNAIVICALIQEAVFLIATSKLLGTCAQKPSIKQGFCCALVYEVTALMTTQLVKYLLDLKSENENWQLADSIDYAVVLLSLSFGWRMPPYRTPAQNIDLASKRS